MPDILLSHGYFLEEDPKEQAIMKPYPPLGLLYVSAFLKRSGYSAELFDSTLRSRKDLYARLAAERGGVLGLYTNLITRKSVLGIVKEAKRHGWTVILGGPESANYPEEYLRRGADVVVMGEGEATLAELLPAIRQGGPHRLHDLSGVAFLDEEGRLTRTQPRDQIADIDSLPWPDRAATYIPEYVDLWRTHHGRGSVNLITARGCPYKCTWCSHAVYGYSHRRRNPLDCANELQHIVETYRPEQVWYADDVFTINHRWLADYATELNRRGLVMPFETISRADRMMREEVLETLARTGCYRIWIGSESGSQRILDAMQRGVTAEQVQWATKAAKRHGIEVGMFLMWGYEGETEADIEETIDHVKRANPDIFFTTVAYPIKNTPYHDRVADRVALPVPWEEATDRDFVIRGRQSREYFRHADRWLKSEIAAFRAQPGSEAALAAALDAKGARAAMRDAPCEVEA